MTSGLGLDAAGEIDAETCADYDKHFVITRQEVDEFIAWYNDNAPILTIQFLCPFLTGQETESMVTTSF